MSIRYTERLAEAGIQPSAGSVGDSYQNAMAETIFGLFTAEVIWPNVPWRTLGDVEFATFEWVDWLNNRRVLEQIGDVPPAKFEAMYSEGRTQLNESPGFPVWFTRLFFRFSSLPFTGTQVRFSA